MTVSNRADRVPDAADGLERVTLKMTAHLDLQAVLDAITSGLVEEFGATLARVWLVGSGDLCAECHMADLCTQREQCLHIRASAGLSANLDGHYRRIPFTGAKMGQIASRRESHWTNSVPMDPRVAHKDWAREHGLRAFAGHPLVAGGELLGALALFRQERLTAEDFRRIEIFARQAAIALRNARRYQDLEAALEKGNS